MLNTIVTVNHCVSLDDVVFTELSHTLHVDNLECYVADGTSKCDVILGRKSMRHLCILLDFTMDSVRWRDKVIPMKPPIAQPRMNKFRKMQKQFLSSYDGADKSTGPKGLENFMSSAEMLKSKCDKVDVDEVANMQKHLSPSQRKELKHVLRKFTRLFSGKLGSYPHRKMHLDVDPQDRKGLGYQRPYSIPHVNRDLFYKELQQLVSLGVLVEVDDSVDFAAPTFLVPQKDGRARWVSDFCELNKVIRRKVYPLPHVNKIMRKRNKHSFFTKLDISMQCYTFESDDESKELCTISTPFGNYHCNRAPMGVKQTPGFAQQVMEQTLRGIHEIEAYIDDVGIFGAPNGNFS